MVQNCGSPNFLLPLQSDIAPQTYEDPKGMWERNLGKESGPISTIPCVGPLIYRLLSRPDSPKLEVPREVEMGLTSLGLW